jgi:hypothetical protein
VEIPSEAEDLNMTEISELFRKKNSLLKEQKKN